MTESRYTRKVEPSMREIPDESDFATELQERSVRHPFLMLAWVGVDYLANRLLTVQVAIEDKASRSSGYPPHAAGAAMDED
jgi:hypothetical protein